MNKNIRICKAVLAAVLSLMTVACDDKAYVGDFYITEAGDADLHVKSISLNKTEATINIGNTLTLTATVAPAYAFDKTIVWSTSNAAVATVNGGVVTRVSGGTAVITATSKDNSKATASCDVTCEAAPEHNGHEYVDLGLTSGTLWATVNIGATSPEDYGDYFAWGETTEKKAFDVSNYKWWSSSDSKWTKYCMNSNCGTLDYKKELDASDDAASANWGGDWRMPSKEQFEELTSECTTQWTTRNGINGCKFTSKKNNDSIFLPAAGWILSSSSEGIGEDGLYLTNSLYGSIGDDSGDVNYFTFTADYNFLLCISREYGYSVRPVVYKSTIEKRDVKVTAISPDESQLRLSAKESVKLEISLTPWYSTDREVVWNSTNPSVASVTQDGVVSYESEGTATIIVSLANDASVTGTCQVTCEEKSAEEILSDGHACVDLGLTSGTLWATMNIGSETPEDYGDYFAWGETSGYDSGKTDFSWSNYKWCHGTEETLTKYCTDSIYGTVDNKTELETEDDAASVNWGGSWRIPSKTQVNELESQCSWKTVIKNGVYVTKITSNTNTNSIYLPWAGYFTGDYHNNGGVGGLYWTCDINDSSNSYAYHYCVYSFGGYSSSYFFRYEGCSIRPVLIK